MQTRVCRLHGKEDIRIESLDVSPPKAGEVRVQVGAGGICGSDLHYYQDGGFGAIRVREPIILGHEVAGTVREIGTGVDGLRPGDRVALNPSHPCGSCKFCASGLFQHCTTMRFFGSALRFPHEQGAFRDQIVLGADQCVPVKDGVTLAEAACAEPLAVCLHARNRAPDLKNRRVLITGAGPIGVLCAALAAEAEASEIVVTDLKDLPLTVAAQMGATRTINLTTNSADFETYTSDKGYFDVTFECSAAAPAIQSAINATLPLGTIIQVGVAGDVPVPLNVIVGKEINFLGSHRFHEEFNTAVALLGNGSIDVKPMITGTFPLENAAEAIKIAGDRGQTVKTQLSFAVE
ncbi:L-idonate 5-dehydrogenase [Litoreibacter meonggei]|uniref:L-idonate 5-dehydrogenase n=1 Tax=Litoreibacter meonggei TaxID=1049199 RepID=A0A497VBQ5_9RHOB|nr:L-idonate 5-dehydrogenase [Litoreibacter meonggei]RLJ41011.1 L-idonate 5-dehydrogenase [Litoreibacter meonggei]